MNHKRYKKYIVVNEFGRPMTFLGDQFIYAETERRRSPVALQSYTHEEAKDLIKQTVEYKIKNNFSVGEYWLIPIGRRLKVKKNSSVNE